MSRWLGGRSPAGQSGFVEMGWARMPALGARFFDALTSGPANRRQVREIAEDLVERCPEGRVLEVGCGPGHLLAELARRAPRLSLVGLDLSPAMVSIARENLAGVEVELEVGSIERTGRPDGSIDLVTCTGSFYIWRDPLRCLEEVRRLLAPGGQAVFFEVHRDVSRLDLLRGALEIFGEQGLLRGGLAPFFLAQAIRMSPKLAEVERLLDRSCFAGAYRVAPVTLASLPIWVRVVLDGPRPATS